MDQVTYQTGVVDCDLGDERGGSVACAECAAAEETYKEWKKHWRIFHKILFRLVCVLGITMVGAAGCLGLTTITYQVWLLLGLGLGIVGFDFGTWWHARARVLTGHWFVVFIDPNNQERHIHAATDDKFLRKGYDSRLGHQLFIPTPGMRGSPSGKYFCNGRELFPASRPAVIQTTDMFGATNYLGDALIGLWIKEVRGDLSCGNSLLVLTDQLLADPELYLQEGPFSWLRDLKAARAKDAGVFAALTALTECMKNDRRSSPPAADARVVLESLVAVSERHRFWIPEEKHGEAARTVEQRVAEIYAQQVEHTRAQAAGRRASRHRSTPAAVTVPADSGDNT